jgi:hypothetical protein
MAQGGARLTSHDVSRVVLSDALRSQWDDDGWCLIERAIPEDDLRAAQDALRRLFPTAEEMDEGDNLGSSPWRSWDAAWPEFPFKSSRLNRLVVHDVMLDTAEQLLRTDDVRLYLALASAKYANQPSGFNQLLHADYPNHTLVVPRTDAGYQHAEFLVYLSDVSTRNGATRLVSRRSTAGIPVERHTLNLEDHASLYEESRDASAPAGSIVAYRPDVYHRSVDISEPRTSRFLLHVAFKPAHTEWIGYQAWPFKGLSPEWHKFVQAATPRQLAVLGFPRPGHPYWTPQTLDGVAARYPDLDMGPWRDASGPRV